MARRLLNGLALVKWGGGPLHEACTSHSLQKSIFSLPYTGTEPLSERQANTKLFLFFLSFFFLTLSLSLRMACRGHITPFTFCADWWGRSSCSLPGCYATHTRSAHAVSSSNTSAAANSQARQSHVNECGSKSQSCGRAFKQQWLRVYFFFLDTHCGSNVCVSNTSQVLSNSNIPALFSSDNATIYSRILWDKRWWLFIANGHFPLTNNS